MLFQTTLYPTVYVHLCIQELMPITDRTSKALLNFSGSQDGQVTPTFPSFLPLEIFDNTEFDCRTPEEWLELGEHGALELGPSLESVGQS